MAVRRMEFGSALPLLFLAVALPGYSVTIQYSGGFGTGSGNFTGVANLGGCSGALLADGIHVLTAAHCAASIAVNGTQTVLTPDITGLGFFTPLFPNGIADAVIGVHINPLAALWFPTDLANSALMYDLAILDLAAPAPADATRYNLDLSGFAIAHNSPVTMAGWGLGGFPSGSVAGTGGTRRAGTNTVAGVFDTAVDGALSVNLLDTPIELLWTTTGPPNNSNDILDPNNTLGLSNAGDSGGPLLFNGNLIGITAFGNLPRGGLSGDIVLVGQTYDAGYMNLANPGNTNFLNSVLTVTPEPGTWILAAAGALLVSMRRRAMRP